MNTSGNTAGGSADALPPSCSATTCGVAFFDLSRMSEWASSGGDAAVASFLQQFYVLSAECLDPSGARIVKFIGDAGLVVIDEDSIDAAVFALVDLCLRTRELALEAGFDSWLNVSLHVGPVIVGEFGPPNQKRFDVIGKAVNVAARLGRRGFTLSGQAFRRLSPKTRERFDKIKRPTNYSYRWSR